MNTKENANCQKSNRYCDLINLEKDTVEKNISDDLKINCDVIYGWLLKKYLAGSWFWAWWWCLWWEWPFLGRWGFHEALEVDKENNIEHIYNSEMSKKVIILK